MQAATQDRYGAPDVLSIQELPRPEIGPDEILIQVRASAVTQGDRRLRAGDFPGVSWLPGRLMMGLLRPRRRVPGTMFAGRVAAVGAEVTRFVEGDDVFGSADAGAWSELMSAPADGPVAKMPAGLGYAEAAALPYGAVTALRFLVDMGRLERGQRILILGASGGVGRLAVQLAAHLGAEVTAVCSAAHHPLVRELGARHVVDYRSEDFTQRGQRYHVVLDTIGAARFGRCRQALTPQGRYLSLIVSLRLLWDMARTARSSGQRAALGVAMGTREDMERVSALVEQGALRPVLDRRFPLAQIADANAHLETARPRGSVVVTIGAPAAAK